eukprot:scaffold69241_cov37-Tisochrysis_lutea.AAC.1
MGPCPTVVHLICCVSPRSSPSSKRSLTAHTLSLARPEEQHPRAVCAATRNSDGVASKDNVRMCLTG